MACEKKHWLRHKKLLNMTDKGVGRLGNMAEEGWISCVVRGKFHRKQPGFAGDSRAVRGTFWYWSLTAQHYLSDHLSSSTVESQDYLGNNTKIIIGI